jgi:hypothetical protein
VQPGCRSQCNESRYYLWLVPATNSLTNSPPRWYTISKMQDTLRHPQDSLDVEKNNEAGDHLESVATRTPPSEMEKNKQLTYTATGSRVVHEKVSHLYQFEI